MQWAKAKLQVWLVAWPMPGIPFQGDWNQMRNEQKALSLALVDFWGQQKTSF